MEQARNQLASLVRPIEQVGPADLPKGNCQTGMAKKVRNANENWSARKSSEIQAIYLS